MRPTILLLFASLTGVLYHARSAGMISPVNNELQMNVKDLIKLFDQFPDADIHFARGSHALKSAIARLPTEPDFFVALAQDHLGKLVHEASLWSDAQLNEHHRFEQIFLEISCYDGRTIDALLFMVDWSTETSSWDVGNNALVSLKAIIDARLVAKTRRSELIAVFEQLMECESLFHNARECRNALSKLDKNNL